MNNFPSRQALKRGWRLFRSCWIPMAVYTLIIWSVALVVLSPLTSWMLNRLVARSGNMVVGNTELIAWLMSPAGLLALTLWGMLALLGVVLEVTGLIWIAAGDAHKGLRSAKQALQQLLPALPNLLNFCLSVFLLCVMVLLPLVAGLAGVYRVFISQYDINYYLTARPAQWWWALACGAAWLLVWAAAAVGLLLRWLYAFPLWLEGVRPFRSTLRASWQATRRSYLFLLRTMGMCLACVILGRVVLESGLFAATGLVLRQLADAVAALFFTISVYLVSEVALQAAVSFVAVAWPVCILVVCYRDQHPAALRPSDAQNGGLPTDPSPASANRAFHPTVILSVLCALLAISAVVSLFLLRQRTPARTPLVIAHRAGALHAPENTLAALEIAIRQQADYAEIDVQRSRDGVVVVIHDADLMKMARDPRRVSETRYAELARVDIGSLFHPDFSGQRVARLADFLEKADGRIKLMIEMKYYGTDAELAPETIRLVREAGMQEQVALMSLDMSAVRQSRQLAPEIPVGYLSSVGLGRLTRLEIDFLAVSINKISSALLRNADNMGLSVYAWTVNDTGAMLDMLELGIDGLITDDSALAVEVIRSVEDLMPVERLLLRFRHLWDVFAKQQPHRPQNAQAPDNRLVGKGPGADAKKPPLAKGEAG